MEQELNGTTPTVNYLTGANIDETFSRTDSTGTYSYLADNLGSTLALTNGAGAISTSYEPYGNTTASGSTSNNTLQYTGRENDGDGLYYNRARYYSPMYERFISEDPARFLGGINSYAYSLGNPITYHDSSGLLTGCEINWLNSNYGTFGGFLADEFNLEQIDPWSPEYSPCSLGTAIGLGIFKSGSRYLLAKSENSFLNLVGDAAEKAIGYGSVFLTAYATTAVWQAELECIDPITGRPKL